MSEFPSAFFERVAEIYRQEWRQVSGAAVAGVAAFAVVILYLTRGGGWVFPLDNANLAFHEFGHPFFGAFSSRLTVYGGTLGQLVFPIVTTGIFWVRREAASCAVCSVWFFENFFNIARYMADARAHQLPLVGGKDPEYAHDWTEIFNRWGELNHDIGIARFTSVLGWIGVIATVLWLVWVWQRQSNEE